MAKTALVTGCSSGIGRATARRFREAGWTVYATAREADDRRELEALGCRSVELDVTDGAAVRAAADAIYEERDRLDCLVNNAGYGQFGAVEDVPVEDVIRQFDVNLFGPLRLVRAVLPRMRQRGSGRIVNVTAGVGGFPLLGMGAYVASKYALESVADSLRQEVSPFGVEVVNVQPGVVATDFYERVREELASVERSPAYDDLYRALSAADAVPAGGPGINSPERVAEAILTAATAQRPSPTYRVGPSATLGTAAGRVLKGRVRDRATRAGVRAAASEPVRRLLRRRSDG